MQEEIEMTPNQMIDNAMSPHLEFSATEWCYCQCMNDEDGLEAMRTKYTALKAKADDYKAQIAAAPDEAAVRKILASATRE